MLTKLSIKNYALIDDLNVSFSQGFTCITGETGAGKSILLGGLSLVLGKRADLSSLRNKEQKCFVEAEFAVDKYELSPFFEEYDLDYERKTIIRREIRPNGKSRAFINDTPVTLDIVTLLGNRLIDVHSQHQTMQLTDNDFQLRVIDALANNGGALVEYAKALSVYKRVSNELDELVAFQQNATKEHEYNSFLLKELQGASLQKGIQEELEEQYEQLNNVEILLELLSKGNQLLNDEQAGVLHLMLELKQVSSKLGAFGSQFSELNERIQSVLIEMDDISGEVNRLQEGAEANPQLLEEVNTKLQLLYDLQKKHNAADVSELMAIRDSLAEKVAVTENIEASISEKEKELEALHTVLGEKALHLTKRRNKVLSGLKKQLQDSLTPLGLPNATFKIEIMPAAEFKGNGKDDLTFLFSANKGSDYGALKKVASGGELSRIMLTIKAILAKYENLPTIMFDEIDTGVSGEVSNRMGDIMKDMGRTMQVFSITHLPQVASKGDHHFKVYKQEKNGVTGTKMKKLERDERVKELAEMLGGKDLSDSAMAHARQLLN